MAQEPIYQTTRRKKRKGLKYIPLAIVLMALAVILGLGAFFRIMNIEVTGASSYSAEEIIAASGIELGDNLLFVKESAVASLICGEMTYIDTVKIIKDVPDTVCIEVTESVPLAAFEAGGKYWIIDKNGRVLEETDTEGAAGMIQVQGIAVTEPVVGERLNAEEVGETRLEYMAETLGAILDTGIRDGVTWIDMSNISDIKFDYMQNLTIEVGRGTDVEAKLLLLGGVIEQKGTEQKGRIDLSQVGEAHFIPQ